MSKSWVSAFGKSGLRFDKSGVGRAWDWRPTLLAEHKLGAKLWVCIFSKFKKDLKLLLPGKARVPASNPFL